MSITYKPTKNKKIFALIELIVAMGILTIFLVIITKFYNTAHRASSIVQEQTMTFENAKIALDLMTREIQCIYYENEHIPFWWHSCQNNDAWEEYSNELLAFPSATSFRPNNYPGTSKLCEIKYQLYYTNDPADPKAGWLRRSVTGNKFSDGNDNPKWNYYNNFIVGYKTDNIAGTDTPIASFTANSSSSGNFEKVIPYVTDLTFSCFNKEGIETNPDTNISTNQDAGIPTEFPFSIEINLSLMDKNAWQKWINIDNDWSDGESTAAQTFRKKHERTFKKTIVIGNRGQYD